MKKKVHLTTPMPVVLYKQLQLVAKLAGAGYSMARIMRELVADFLPEWWGREKTRIEEKEAAEAAALERIGK